MLNSDKALLDTACALIEKMKIEVDKLEAARKDLSKLSEGEDKCDFIGANFHVFGHTYRLSFGEALEFLGQKVARLSRSLETTRVQLTRVLKDIVNEPDEV